MGFCLMQSPERDNHGPRDAGAIKDILARLSVTAPAIAETATRIYLAAKRPSHYSNQQLRAASVYASCRLFRVPRTLNDVASRCGVGTTFLGRCYMKVVQDAGVTMPVQDQAAYIPAIASRTGLDSRTELRAVEIVRAAVRLLLTEGKAPNGVAAAALYRAHLELHSGESHDPMTRVTQKDIAQAAGISEVTLRNRLRTFYRVADEPIQHSG